MDITGTSWFVRLREFARSLSGWIERIGMTAIMVIVAAALVDVIGGKVFNRPLPGGTEIVGVIQVVAIAGGLAASKLHGSHVHVGFLIDRLSGRRLAGLQILISILTLALWVIAAWMTFDLGVSLLGRGTETLLLYIPLYPFAFWIAFCCIPMSFVILLELITSIEKVTK